MIGVIRQFGPLGVFALMVPEVAPVVEGGLHALLGVGAMLGAVQAMSPAEGDERSSPAFTVWRARARLPSIPIRRSVISRRTVSPSHVIRVVIGRRAGVRALVGVLVVPRADGQPVSDHQRARWAHPGGLEDHRSGHVADRQRHDDPVGTDAEGARPAVQQRPEDARRVKPRDAQPFDAPVGRDHGPGRAVGQERVVRDRRERRAAAQRRVVGREENARTHSGRAAWPVCPPRISGARTSLI